ncbi:MAG: Alkyl hydroperoxide reductase/Thiol specific antioxidant [Pseudonocardiales bacterium]|jgi:thiol-disulfide isomerase/thioredoxin|nr:Alkyl hydroperoxide reductase/Thiol specific antioxidant [Pseudonocardiales bacterium]
MNLRRWPPPLLAVAVAVLLLAGCAGKNAVDQSSGQFRFVSGTSLGKTYPVADRKKAGDFTGTLLNGGSLTLSQDAGKVVVVNFWASWCGPCLTETPQLDSVYRSNKSKGVSFVGVDTKDNRDPASSFVKQNDITFPIVFDEKGEAALRLGKIPALGLPFTVLIDKHQRVAAVYLSKLTAKDLQPALNTLLAES